MSEMDWVAETKDIVSRLNCHLNEEVFEKFLSLYLMEEDLKEKSRIKNEIKSILGVNVPLLLFSNKPMLSSPKKEDIDGEIKIGKVFQGGKMLHDFGLSKEELNQHCLITARSGFGKTCLIMNVIAQFIENKMPFMAFDFKQDLRHLIKSFPELWVFRHEDLRLNLLRPPLGISLQKWEQIFCDCYAFNYGWFHGSRNLMQEYLHTLYQDKGNNATLSQLYELFKIMSEQTRRRQEYYDVVTNRLFSTVTNLGETIDCKNGFPIEELLEHPVVIELDGLARDEQNLIVEWFLFWIYAYRLAQRHRGTLRHCLIFDEGKRVFDSNKEFKQATLELGVAPVDIITDEIREFGEGIIVADQEPTKLTHSIKANTYTKITGSLGHGGDIKDITEAMNLKEEEMNAIPRLERGEWLVKLAGKYTKPFMIKSSDFPIVKDITDEQIRRHMQPVIAKLTREEEKVTISKSNEPEVIQPELSEDARLLLVNIANHPFKGLTGRYSDLRLSGRRASSAKNELIQRELIREVSIPLGGYRPVKFLVLTNVAINMLKYSGHDVRLWRHTGHMGFKHQLITVLIAYSYRRAGYKTFIEKEMANGRRVDVLTLIDDRKVAVEVETGSIVDIENKLTVLEEVDELIIVADKACIQEAQSCTKNLTRRKVRIYTVSEFLRLLKANYYSKTSGNNYINRKKASLGFDSRNKVGKKRKKQNGKT